MEKAAFQADPQDKHSQADRAAGFSTDAEMSTLTGFSIRRQTYKVP